MSSPAFRIDDSPPDPSLALEQHLLAGFPPDLALDLALNELVVRACESTGAGGAALAVFQENELICRAAHGPLAPPPGSTTNARKGLAGDCLSSRRPQYSADTDEDTRIDHDFARHDGIRCVLMVPLFETEGAPVGGILEVCSALPAAFSDKDQEALEALAPEYARIRQTAIEVGQRKIIPPPELIPPGADASQFLLVGASSERILANAGTTSAGPATKDSAGNSSRGSLKKSSNGSSFEVWTVLLGALACLAIMAVGFLMGSRVGLWLPPAHQAEPPPPTSTAVSAVPAPAAPIELELTTGDAAGGRSTPPAQTAAISPSGNASAASDSISPKRSSRARERSREKAESMAPSAANGDLVVYEKGKVIFRLKPTPPGQPHATERKPAPDETGAASAATAPLDPSAPASGTRRLLDGIVASSSTTKISPKVIWLAPAQAEKRLVGRVDPPYPASALADRRSGNAVLEVQVAEDGTVASVRPVSGDPVLAAAAVAAVRNWRYRPYRLQDQPKSFQTDVTVTFTPPN